MQVPAHSRDTVFAGDKPDAPADPLGWAFADLNEKVRIGKVAGSGSFGVVYEAFHSGFGETVAVKCLRLGDGLSEGHRNAIIESFQNEARLLHKLSRRSANVVQALDVGAAVSPRGVWTPYIVMEWLEGKSLEQELTSRITRSAPPLSVDEMLDLLWPILDALSLAHEENVCHRDLKPANLFLAKEVKVLDFGIAKVVESTGAMTRSLGQTARSVVGPVSESSSTLKADAIPFHAFTPQYGAPEQFSVQWGATGPWTDVFSMALVMIEVASGSPALEGTDLLQFYVAATDPLRRPSLARRGVSVRDEVEAALLRAVEVDPARRFRTMGDLRAALVHARQVGTRSALRPSSAPRKEPGGGGENRLATVLFAEPEFALADLAVGPEEQARFARQCADGMAACATARGGVTTPVAGGGLMAVWGVPVATDGDAELSVQAGLDMRAALSRMVRKGVSGRTPPPKVRIGIATGRVFVPREGEAPVGGAVNLAAHLGRNAAPDSVLVSRDTCRHIAGRFAVEPTAVGSNTNFVSSNTAHESSVAGRDERTSRPHAVLEAFVVRGPAAPRPTFAPQPFYGLETKFVGRAAEMARLLDLWQTAATECQCHLVTVVGERGSGLTRLLGEFCQQATAGNFPPRVVFVAQGAPATADTGHGLVVSLLSAAFHIHPDDSPEVVRRKLRRGMRHILTNEADGSLFTKDAADGDTVDRGHAGPVLTTLRETVDDIAALFGATPAGRAVPPLMLGADDTASPMAQQIRAAFGRLLGAIGAVGPVLLVCDDMAWADPASVELLRDLPLSIPETPVLVVCAVRPDFMEHEPRWKVDVDARARVDLPPLAQRHIEDMARDRLRKVEGLSPELLQRLARRADRLPLALTETLALLIDTGVIEAPPTGPWVLHEQHWDETLFPTTIAGLSQARFDRLEVTIKDALARAAVIGKTFWASALDKLLGVPTTFATASSASPEPPSQSPTQRNESLLDQLQRQRLVTPTPTSLFAGERQFVFTQNALHEVAYATLTENARKPLHCAVAAWLEGHHLGVGGAALLAWHYERAGSAKRAADEHLRAAAHSEGLGQNAEALHHLERCAAIHSSTEQTHGEARSESADRRIASSQERALVLLRLGDALRFAGRWDDALSAYERARQFIVALERRAPFLSDPREVAVWEARLDSRHAAILKVRGATAEARVLVERAIERATAAFAEAETLSMWAMLAVLHRRMRDPVACRKAALAGMRVARSTSGISTSSRGVRTAAAAAPSHQAAASVHLRDGRFREDVARLLLALAASFYSEGKMVRAERCYRQASRCVTADESPHTLGLCLNGIAGARLARGDLTVARDMLLASFRLKERAGDFHQLAIAHNNLAEVCFRLGNPSEALKHARQAVAIGVRIQAASDLPDMYRNLAESSLACADGEAALDACEKAMAAAIIGGGRVYLLEVALAGARVTRALALDDSHPELLRNRARAMARAVLAFVQTNLTEPRLEQGAKECRTLLGEIFGTEASST